MRQPRATEWRSWSRDAERSTPFSSGATPDVVIDPEQSGWVGGAADIGEILFYQPSDGVGDLEPERTECRHRQRTSARTRRYCWAVKRMSRGLAANEPAASLPIRLSLIHI